MPSPVHPLHDRPWWLSAAIYALALLLVALSVGPALWLVAVSLSSAGVPLRRLPSPAQLTLSNFSHAWHEGQLARPLLNSVLITLVQASLNVLLAALAAYPLASMRFRGRRALFILILSTLMVPEQVVLVPVFRTIVALGWYDSFLAVIIPGSVSAVGIYLCKQAMAAIPGELEEAAAIDGASALHIWWHVMLPLIRPTLATLAAFSIIGAWSALLWPLVVLASENNQTLPVAIDRLLGAFATNARFAYAASVIALVPIVFAYLVLQRWLKSGLLAGAIKG